LLTATTAFGLGEKRVLTNSISTPYPDIAKFHIFSVTATAVPDYQAVMKNIQHLNTCSHITIIYQTAPKLMTIPVIKSNRYIAISNVGDLRLQHKVSTKTIQLYEHYYFTATT